MVGIVLHFRHHTFVPVCTSKIHTYTYVHTYLLRSEIFISKALAPVTIYNSRLSSRRSEAGREWSRYKFANGASWLSMLKRCMFKQCIPQSLSKVLEWTLFQNKHADAPTEGYTQTEAPKRTMCPDMKDIPWKAI